MPGRLPTVTILESRTSTTSGDTASGFACCSSLRRVYDRHINMGDQKRAIFNRDRFMEVVWTNVIVLINFVGLRGSREAGSLLGKPNTP